MEVLINEKPRRRFVAVLLTLALPGLGDLYLGQPRRGVITFLGYYAFAAVCLALVFAPLPGPAALLPLVLGLSAIVLLIVRAATATPFAPDPHPLGAYDRWYWYLLPVLFALFVWQPRVEKLMRSQVRAFRNPSGAMEPTLQVGDFFFVSMRRSARHPRHNDIIVMRSTEGLMTVKRVVGLPGDTLAMRNGVLSRNGQQQREPFTQLVDPVHTGEPLREGRAWHVAHLASGSKQSYQATMRDWGPLVVPTDSVFVLGDNRDNSYDSRFFGAIGMNRVVGKPLVVYFSVQSNPFAIRWSRLGKRF